MRKVLRVLFIVLSVITGGALFFQTVMGDFEFSSFFTFIGILFISKSFKEKRNESEFMDVNNNINKVPITKLEIDEKNTIMVINEIYTLLGEGTVVLGEILQECIEPGMQVLVKTQNGKVIETTILNFREKIGGINRAIDRAYKGNYITVYLRGINRDEISVGDLISYKNI